MGSFNFVKVEKTPSNISQPKVGPKIHLILLKLFPGEEHRKLCQPMNKCKSGGIKISIFKIFLISFTS